MRRRVTMLYLAAALAAFFGAARIQPTLLRLRREHHLSPAEDPLENMPPLVVFTTVALGSFRGLLVDALWMRASRLQEEGKYFELVQLAGWITQLQPRFASIWAFHAWNMAYNVSVMLASPEDRWRWVRHGISLLRDDALRYNPGNPQIHRELAWLFSHKMGADMDQAHFHYKREWAREMTRVFGGGRPDFDRLIAAPPDPDALRAIPGVAELLAELEAAGIAPPYDRALDSDAVLAMLVARAETDAAARAALDYLRARRARRVYKLDPARMKEVDERYGPLDWRLPGAHAIYWAWRGLPSARNRFDRLSLDRAIFQSMADAFLRGRLAESPDLAAFALTPNLELYDRVHAAYEKALNDFPGDPTLPTAFANFLTDAVLLHYTYNLEARARAIYDELRARFPKEENAGGFEAFVVRIWREYARDLPSGQAAAFVESALYQSHFWAALGERERAAGFARMAALVWNRYMEERKNPEFRERTGLPPLEEMDRVARERVREMIEAARQRNAEIRSDPRRLIAPTP